MFRRQGPLGSRFMLSYRRIARRRPVCPECGRLIRGRRVRRLGAGACAGLCYQCARSAPAQKGEAP
jgi:hypothetical protein